MAEPTSIYADAQHYDLLAQMTAPADLPFYEKLLARHGGPLLELGCGTARVLSALCRPNIECWGIDTAAPLLEMGRATLAAAGLSATLLEADFRDFDLGRTFRLLLFPYNAFNHLYEIDDVVRCLAAIKRHMDAHSLLVIDTFNPDPAKLFVEPPPPQDILRYLDPHSGEQVVLSEVNHYDAATQISHITWAYRVGER